MARHIYKCPKCDIYTMKDICECGEKTVSSKPPKYSPEDKYASYRRKIKKEELIKKGLA